MTGWTDDLRVRIDPDRTIDERVERTAARVWLETVEARSPRVDPAWETAELAVHLGELAEAMNEIAVTSETKARVRRRLGTALGRAGQSVRALVGATRCAESGSDAWVDAIHTQRWSRRLAEWFERDGDLANAASALEVRRRVVTGAMGYCYERVGAAMLDLARMEVRLDENPRAASMCDAVVEDFTRLIDRLEDEHGSPFDEDRVALAHLGDALQLREQLGDAPSSNAALAARVARLVVSSEE